jgi:hypothetical protein
MFTTNKDHFMTFHIVDTEIAYRRLLDTPGAAALTRKD